MKGFGGNKGFIQYPKGFLIGKGFLRPAKGFNGSLLNYPKITNVVVSGVLNDGFTVTATVNPYGKATPVLEYGLTTSYGSTVNATEGEISATGTVTFTVTGLTGYLTYNFRIKVDNSLKITYTENQTETTIQRVTVGEQVIAVKNYASNVTLMGNTIQKNVNAATWANATTLYTNAYNSAFGTEDEKIYEGLKAAAMCNSYSANAGFEATYGLLYNWYAVALLQKDIDKYKALGNVIEYYVPTQANWITCINALGGITVAGGKMKEAGTTNWAATNLADNASGLTFLPAGYKKTNGDETGLTTRTFFASLDVSTNSHYAVLNYNSLAVSQIGSATIGSPLTGMSLRFFFLEATEIINEYGIHSESESDLYTDETGIYNYITETY